MVPDPDIYAVNIKDGRVQTFFNRLLFFFPANFKAEEKEEVLFYLLMRARSVPYSRFPMQLELLLVCMSRCLFAQSSFPDMHGKHIFCQRKYKVPCVDALIFGTFHCSA